MPHCAFCATLLNCAHKASFSPKRGVQLWPQNSMPELAAPVLRSLTWVFVLVAGADSSFQRAFSTWSCHSQLFQLNATAHFATCSHLPSLWPTGVGVAAAAAVSAMAARAWASAASSQDQISKNKSTAGSFAISNPTIEYSMHHMDLSRAGGHRTNATLFVFKGRADGSVPAA
eukprot:1159111-Pelagomonas_calceolata.AAC.3